MSEQDFSGGYADDAGDGGYYDEGDYGGVSAQDVLEQFVQAQQGAGPQGDVQAAIAPLAQQVAEMQLDRTADNLTAEFPHLAEPGVAEEFVQLAQGLADHIGLQDWRSPQFLRVVAESFSPSGGQHPAHGQQRGQQGVGIAEQILAAGGRKSGFWGI